MIDEHQGRRVRMSHLAFLGSHRVNGVSAGPIKTLASAGIPGLSMMLQAQRERAPLRRGMELGEIADAAVFLLSHAARAVTGEVLMVDAGYHVVGI